MAAKCSHNKKNKEVHHNKQNTPVRKKKNRITSAKFPFAIDYLFFLEYLDSFSHFETQSGTALEGGCRRIPLEYVELTVRLESTIVPLLAQASCLVINTNSSEVKRGQSRAPG